MGWGLRLVEGGRCRCVDVDVDVDVNEKRRVLKRAEGGRRKGICLQARQFGQSINSG